MADKNAGRGASVRVDEVKRMVGPENDCVAAIQPEGEALIAAFALTGHLDRTEGRRFDVDVELLRRSYQDVASVRFAPQHRREQADHRPATDRAPLVVPGSVTRDAHGRMAAMLGIPPIDGRQATLVDQLLQLGEAHSLQLDR